MRQTTTGSADSAARERGEGRGAGMMDQAKLKAGQIYNQVNRNLNEQYERVLGYGRRSPGKATLIVFGAGVGLRLLVAGSIDAQRSRGRLIEPVMNALSALTCNLIR
jgi:hypothetical protein